MKRTILGPSNLSDDSEFIAARDSFVQLHAQLNALRLHITAYNKAVAGVHASSLAVAKDYANILEPCPRPHPFAHLLLTLCHGHNDLAERGASGAYTLPVLDVINRQFELHKDFLTRIEVREKHRVDWQYYVKKVGELLQERTKRTRPEKPTETEKIERNQAKLQLTQQRYEDFHRDLLHDLHVCLETRLTTYGPSMRLFVDAETAFLADYGRAMGGVEVKDAEPKLSVHTPVNGFRQPHVAIPAEHSPLLDDKLSISADDAFSRASKGNPFGSLDPSPIGGLTPTSALRKKAASTLFDGDGTPPQFLYPYEMKAQASPSAPAPSPPSAHDDPFAGLGEEAEGVPHPLVNDGMAGYSDPFANGGGSAFFDYGAPAATPAASSSSSASRSSASRPASVSGSAAAPPAVLVATPSVAAAAPEYHPVLYEVHALPALAPSASEPLMEAPAAEVVPGEIEAEAGEEETEEDEEVPAQLQEQEAQNEPDHAASPPALEPAAAPAPASAPVIVAAVPPRPAAVSGAAPLRANGTPAMPSRPASLSPTRPPPSMAAPAIPVSAPPASRPQPQRSPSPLPPQAAPIPTPSAAAMARLPNPFDDD